MIFRMSGALGADDDGASDAPALDAVLVLAVP